MGFEITYKQSVERDWAELNLDSPGKMFNKMEAGLLDNPRQYPMVKGPYAGLARMKLGKLRVIFTISGGEIIVLRIGQRLDLYAVD